MDATKRCPMCGEEILAIAIKCKHCGELLGDHPAQQAGLAPRPHWKAPLFFWLGSWPSLTVLTFLILAVIFKSNYDHAPNIGGNLLGSILVTAGFSLVPALIVGIPFTLLYPVFTAKGWPKRFIVTAVAISTAAFMVEWIVLEGLLVDMLAKYPSSLHFDESAKFSDAYVICTLAAGAASVLLATWATPRVAPTLPAGAGSAAVRA